MLCARALVRALNDAKNRAQQGCAMQFSGITLRKVAVQNLHFNVLSCQKLRIIVFLKCNAHAIVLYQRRGRTNQISGFPIQHDSVSVLT